MSLDFKRKRRYDPAFRTEYKLDTGLDPLGNIHMDSPTLDYVIWLEKKLEEAKAEAEETFNKLI